MRDSWNNASKWDWSRTIRVPVIHPVHLRPAYALPTVVDFTNHVTTGHCLLLESHERILFRCDGEKKEGLRSFLGQSSGLQC
jgi:hypothetical protein